MNRRVFMTLLSSLCLLYAYVPLAATAASFAKGTVVKTELAQPVATATLKPGDSIELRVVQPYPDNDPNWEGARIAMHVTDVTQGTPGTRARVGFLFDRITLRTGASKPFAAFVISSAVVRRGGSSSSQSSAGMAQAQPPSSITGRSQTSTVFWQHKVGSGSSNTAPTGGYAYARQPGVEVTLPEGSVVTLELASPLDIP
ncbi:MAG: hypothetical protein ACXWNK_14635 [Vulcanimicrobiaceae bacterium]